MHLFPFSVIKEEATDSRAEVKSFDHGKLKHVETAEKNPLPTQADIKEELRPESLPDVSEVKDFDAHKLKHVEVQDKTVLPTKDGKTNWVISFIITLGEVSSLKSIGKEIFL